MSTAFMLHNQIHALWSDVIPLRYTNGLLNALLTHRENGGSVVSSTQVRWPRTSAVILHFRMCSQLRFHRHQLRLSPVRRTRKVAFPAIRLHLSHILTSISKDAISPQTQRWTSKPAINPWAGPGCARRLCF